jgi:hypothetical protein
MQTQHEHAASTNRALLASENHGKPAIAATTKPGEFNHCVVAAGASHNSSPNGGNKPPSNAANVQKSDRPPSSTANTTNASHANNGTNNPPKNQSHPQNKPPAQNKPPKEEGKPHK